MDSSYRVGSVLAKFKKNCARTANSITTYGIIYKLGWPNSGVPMNEITNIESLSCIRKDDLRQDTNGSCSRDLSRMQFCSIVRKILRDIVQRY